MDGRVENWDDLRVFLAVARAKTVRQAAATLRVDPTTVTRRVAAFEESLGVSLFDHVQKGIALSPQGEAMLEAAVSMEASVQKFELRAVGSQQEPVGLVRIAVAELLVMAWTEELVAFCKAHPKLSVEVVAGDEMHNLSKREADIAVRVAQRPPPHLVGRKFSPVAVSVYGSAKLRRAHDIHSAPWIGWSGLTDDEGAVGQTRARLGATGRFVVKANSYGLMMDFVRAGAGVCVLPCGLGDFDPLLERFAEPELLPQPLWLLTHPDLQHAPRVRAVFDELSRIIEQTADRLAPKDS